MQKIYAPTTIAIADSHELYRYGLKAVIDLRNELKICIEVHDYTTLIPELQIQLVDVIVIGADAFTYPIWETMRKIAHDHPHIPIIVLSMFREKNALLRLVRIGVRGFLFRNATKDEVIKAIAAVNNGKYHQAKGITARLGHLLLHDEAKGSKADTLDWLTPNEIQLIRHMCSGLSIKEIAVKLHANIRTLESRRQNLYNKVGIHTIAGIMNFAIRNGIYDPSE